MFKIDQKRLFDLLRASQLTVVFTKQDGTERTMLCTLQDALLPEESGPSGPIEPYIGDGSTVLFKVWDLERADWRSFRLDTLKSVKIAGISVL